MEGSPARGGGDPAGSLDRLGRHGRVGWIVLQRPVGGALEILELTRVQRPEKGRKPKATEQERCRDEPGERRHERPSQERRVALRVTRIEDVDMTMAAISGVT